MRRRSACRSPSTSGNPRSAECTSWERRSSEMTELSASAGSEGYAACDDEAQCWSPSAAGNPRSAECTSWERRSSGMTEFSAKAGNEGCAACDDDGGLYCQKRPSRPFLTVSGALPSGRARIWLTWSLSVPLSLFPRRRRTGLCGVCAPARGRRCAWRWAGRPPLR